MVLSITIAIPLTKLLRIDMVNDFEEPVEFTGKSEEEMLQEFLDECPVTDESYVSVYGGYYSVMKDLLPSSKNVLVWMAFNSELDRGRILMQSLAVERLMSELGISEMTYYKSIVELKTKDAIRGGKAKYYINPKFMWKGGDRRRRKFLNRYPFIANEK